MNYPDKQTVTKIEIYRAKRSQTVSGKKGKLNAGKEKKKVVHLEGTIILYAAIMWPGTVCIIDWFSNGCSMTHQLG